MKALRTVMTSCGIILIKRQSNQLCISYIFLAAEVEWQGNGDVMKIKIHQFIVTQCVPISFNTK